MLGRGTFVALGLAAVIGVAPVAAESPNAAGSQAKPARARIGKVPFRVVKLLPETRQALVYDADRGAHVLVAEGDRIGGFEVTEIEAEHVVVTRDGRDVMLVVDPQAPQPPRAAGPAPAPPPAAPAEPATPAEPTSPVLSLLDPYLDLLDPYGLLGVREVLAPPAQRAPQISDVVDPYAEPKEPVKVVAPPEAKPVPPTPAPGSPTAPDAIRADTMTIQRRELEAALADFAKLGREIGFTRADRGVKLGKIATGSYFFSLGLRSGDVVTAIDGKPLRGLDDAAAAYARLSSARQLALDVERAGGATGTLKFALK